ncbi:RNA-directed DNA polymerase, eukaryota [Tanacetum coccineum]
MGVISELESINLKKKFIAHSGVASWFSNLCNAQLDFVFRNRIVWVDIEGVPIHAWSRATFNKIGSKWGEVMEIEECKDDLFARKRICIKTSQEDNILEKFKIIVNRESVRDWLRSYLFWSPVLLQSYRWLLFFMMQNSSKVLIEVKGDDVVKDKTPVLSQRQSEGFCSRVMEDLHRDADHSFSDNNSIGNKGRDSRKGGSILDVLDGMVKVGQAMGYDMDGLGSKAKKDWARELIGKHKVNFISLQETKLESISSMDVKFIWDNFIAIAGTWIPSNSNLLIISVYAPQPRVEKRLLWNYISSLITHWQGDALVLGDFNEVRNTEERRGSVFNLYGAADFNEFISSSGLIDIMLEGYSFTWSHPSACKMSKLDRFLVTEGFLSVFPHCSAICLDRHLSDHRPILLRELQVDYGATPFRFYHSWLNISGFDLMVSQTWNSLSFNDSNDMIRFKKKLQALKKYIREWIIVHKKKQMGRRDDISLKLNAIDKQLDQGNVNDDILLSRMNLMKQLHDIKSADSRDSFQKAKIKWAVEGDKNSKFFHGIINRKRANLAIKGILADGDWIDAPCRVKAGFGNHFANRFRVPCDNRSRINFPFPNRLSSDQADLLEEPISSGEIRIAVWACVDFAKAYDSVRWDFLDDVLSSFGFGLKWRSWILGSLSSGKASVLVNDGLERSLRRQVRGGVEAQQLSQIQELVLWIVQFVLWFMKARLISFLAALWQRILLALFVDGGIWDGRLLVLTSSCFLGSRMSNWVPFSMYAGGGCRRVSFKYLGGRG